MLSFQETESDLIFVIAFNKQLTGVVLDKSMTLTDWSLRPLSSAQIVYALNDVRYLLVCRKKGEKKTVLPNLPRIGNGQALTIARGNDLFFKIGNA